MSKLGREVTSFNDSTGMGFTVLSDRGKILWRGAEMEARFLKDYTHSKRELGKKSALQHQNKMKKILILVDV